MGSSASLGAAGSHRLSRVARHAASRAAWKRRGEISNSEGVRSSSSSYSSQTADELEAEEFAPPAPSRSSSSSGFGRHMSQSNAGASSGAVRRCSSTGMYRDVPHRAVDSARCHWLLPPESLLIRVDPATSAFLTRQWLALAQIKTRDGSTHPQRSTSRTGRNDKRSFPARLHAGWLAQTLRPKG